MVYVQQPSKPRQYPEKYNRLTDEERWATVGKAFDQYDAKMIKNVDGSIDSLLVFVRDLLLLFLDQDRSCFAGRSFLRGAHSLQYPCIRISPERSYRCYTHHPCPNLTAAR